MKNWAMNMPFNPYTYSLRPFSRGRRAPNALPRLSIDSDPSAFLGLTQ